MAKSVSYEVLSTRGDNWMIESVNDDREVALYEARTLLDSRYVKAVKVVQETYDDEVDRTTAKTIFNKASGAAKGKPQPETEKKKSKDAATAPAVGRKKGGSEVVKYLIILVLSIGGIALVMLTGAAFLMDTFDGK